MTSYDHINPSHYQLENGVEVIDLTEQLDFLSGNAIKYIARAGKKPDQPKLQDLTKALWYLTRLIDNEKKRLENDKSSFEKSIEMIGKEAKRQGIV
mgnify:CR=1 FL=1